MKYVIVVIAALVHSIFLNIGSSSESLTWLWNGLAFAAVWVAAEEVGRYTRTNA